MIRKREAKQQKALYFDLSVSKLKENFSETNPTGGYGKIRDYLIQRDFTHEQYSGYHSRGKLMDLDIFNMVLDMGNELVWLPSCLNRFEVTNVGTEHDLMRLFHDAVATAL